MAANGSPGAMDFARWLYARATSHPIGQIEQTLNTGKPPQPKMTTAPSTPAAKSSPAKPSPSGFRRYGPKAPASALRQALTKKP